MPWGRGALAAFGLVAATGLLTWFQYGGDALEASRGWDDAGSGLSLARSLHLWSSRAFILALVCHVGADWWRRRRGPLPGPAHAWGAGALAGAGVAHWTGHVLRWDDVGRALAGSELALLQALGLFPDASTSPDDGSFLRLHVPVHAALVPLGLLVATLVHVGRARSAALPAVPVSAPMVRSVPASTLVVGVLVVLLAIAWPAPAEGAAWPLDVFLVVSDAGAWQGTATILAAAAWTLVLAQPWIRQSAVARVAQGALGALFLGSFWATA